MLGLSEETPAEIAGVAMTFERPLLNALREADKKWEAARKRRDAARLRYNRRQREQRARRKEAES